MTNTLKDSYDTLVKDVQAYAKFGEDWDGEGALAFTPATLDYAVNLLTKITEAYPNMSACDVGPYCDNTVDLWWRDGGGYSLLINVDSKGMVDYYGDDAPIPTDKRDKIVKGTQPLDTINLDFIKVLYHE